MSIELQYQFWSCEMCLWKRMSWKISTMWLLQWREPNDQTFHAIVFDSSSDTNWCQRWRLSKMLWFLRHPMRSGRGLHCLLRLSCWLYGQLPKMHLLERNGRCCDGLVAVVHSIVSNATWKLLNGAPLKFCCFFLGSEWKQIFDLLNLWELQKNHSKWVLYRILSNQTRLINIDVVTIL